MTNYDLWNGRADFEEKALTENDDNYVLKGYAATYDEDRVGDVIVPGAFKACLDRMAKKGETLQLYFNHELKVPIGAVTMAQEDRKGLRYEALLPKSDTLVSGRIVPQIKCRALKQNSFGYKVRESERRKSDNVRLLKRLDIFEISVVGFPANPAANIESIKGLVEFQGLPIDMKAATWNPEAALKRLRDRFGNSDEIKSAFLFVDEDRGLDALDAKLLIADIDENGCIKANQQALFKASAAIAGARGGVKLPEEAVDAVKDHLDRYYGQMNLESPFKSFSVLEYEALDPGEREARLKGLGLSGNLAKKLLSQGPRDADRTPSQREAVTPEGAKALFNAFAEFISAASAIQPKPAG